MTSRGPQDATFRATDAGRALTTDNSSGRQDDSAGISPASAEPHRSGPLTASAEIGHAEIDGQLERAAAMVRELREAAADVERRIDRLMAVRRRQLAAARSRRDGS